MSVCPKCSSDRIMGPRFQRDNLGNESLAYTCATCGYIRLEPTHDRARYDRFLDDMMQYLHRNKR